MLRPAIVRSLAIFAALFVVSAARIAAAQGVLINEQAGEKFALPRPDRMIWPPFPPHPPLPHPIPHPTPIPQSEYKIKELSVQAKLVDQVAKVQVTQSFVNTGSRQMEVAFVFPLPYDGAVDRLTFMVDGKEYPAKLIEAKEARKMYEAIVRKNQDPALLEWMGTGLFKTSVFPVPPGAERKVTLRYSQLCRTSDGLTDFLFPLSTAKYTTHPVEEVKFDVSIESESNIKNIYSPSHAVDIKRPDDKHATVSYNVKNQLPTADFRLFFDVGKGQVGTRVLSYRPKDSEDGYFLLLTSPEIKAADAERPKKTVFFVVDRSGSMSGDKIEQAKNAAKFVLNNLREGDLFNVIAFDSEVEAWKPELQKFNDETRKAALGFVSGIYAGGSTNIDGAMKTALKQLKDSKQPTFVLFLTDGIPTVGETNEAKIVAHSKDENHVHARVFAFGVGYDLNSRLLDKLVRTNFGQSEYVRPNENIETKVSALYNKIGSPVLTDMKITFDVDGAKSEDGHATNRVYPKDAGDLFAGEQLVIAGRYKKSGTAKVVVTGKVGDKEQKFDFPATLTERSNDESYAFVEKLWAVRRVGEILDEIDLKGKNDELVKELVTLATQHGILTPYTSFMADDQVNTRDLSSNLRRAGDKLDAFRETDGQFGVENRATKGSFQKAASPAEAAAAPAFQIADAKDAANQPASGSSGSGLNGRGIASSPGKMGRDHAFGAGGAVASTTAGTLSISADQDEGKRLANNVRNIAGKSFYRRDNRWVDAKVTEKQEKEAVKIERFSKEYFELIDKFGKDVSKYMTFDEPVVIELGGKAYTF